MLDREKLSSHLHRGEEQLLAGHIFDKIEMVLKRKSEESTNFLNPYECEIAEGLLQQIYEVNYLIDGGYQGAERNRVTVFPEYLFPEHVDPQVEILKIEGNFKFQPVNHRDFLGALMGLGIKREMIGDILILKEMAEVVVAAEMVEFIITKLTKVHQVPVEVMEIKSKELILPSNNTKEIKTTVASMRLDAVASAGFGDSRNKISRDIKSEKVKLNWKTVADPACSVEIGDLISIRGRGRVNVVERIGLSNRGRIKLSLERYT
ncbi:photosystem II S4 domain protein [Iocasia frigidifontis]|uniref:Photosystem II S4 domain protein n=1 Tax=Iocasia fonsfrigidae TaxID=2682810 RepID=A0A8A7KGP6_9FIRM|nr:MULTISPECIES: photosystem II S4 domain protein [Halanaerobiaceae]AZO95109.1 photosystem II S4 domain protein [Halocella sp. SP3-1]QTL98057.1 photosystem II S4 domain protein [Iocasia fonsfrigidae]